MGPKTDALLDSTLLKRDLGLEKSLFFEKEGWEKKRIGRGSDHFDTDLAQPERKGEENGCSNAASIHASPQQAGLCIPSG